MESDTIVAVGGSLFVLGLVMFLAYHPTIASLSNRIMGYETPRLTRPDFEQYNLISTTIMPIVNILIGIGLALFLLGVLSSIRQKK